MGDWVAVVPIGVLVASVLLTRRALESLFAASVAGFVILDGPGFFNALMATTREVMAGEKAVFVYLICAVMGAFVAVMEKSGGPEGFVNLLSRKVASRRGVLLSTWLMSLVIFIDDFLISLTLGSCMRRPADSKLVPREMLAYVVNSSAAPVASLIPISTWAIFIAALLEKYLDLPTGEGVRLFVRTIPFNFYAWLAFLMVPLVVLGVIPVYGPMKAAEERVRATGVLAPPGSEKLDMHGSGGPSLHSTPRARNLFVPLAALIGCTLAFDVDLVRGGTAALLIMAAFYRLQGLMGIPAFVDTAMDGVRSMLLPMVFTTLAFLYNEVNQQLGLISLVLTEIAPVLTPELLPAILFIVLSLLGGLIGISWSLYVVAFPIVIPLVQTVGADLPLSIAAVVAAGTLAMHCCFYSDGTILVAAATGCDNLRHAVTQLPLALVAALGAAALFLVAGFVL